MILLVVENRVVFMLSGIMHPHDSTALGTEEGVWDLTMLINLKGVWWGCKHAIIAMRNNPAEPDKGLHKGGSIINTASFVALMGAATPQLACPFVQILPIGNLFLLNDPRYCLQRWRIGHVA